MDSETDTSETSEDSRARKALWAGFTPEEELKRNREAIKAERKAEKIRLRKLREDYLKEKARQQAVQHPGPPANKMKKQDQQPLVSNAGAATHDQRTTIRPLPTNSFMSIPDKTTTTDKTTTNTTTDQDGFEKPKHTARPKENPVPTPIPTENKYESLTVEMTEPDKTNNDNNINNDNRQAKTTTPTTPRPVIGAINIDNNGLTNPTQLIEDLQHDFPGTFYARSTKTELIIQAKTIDGYKKILKALETIELNQDLRTKYFDKDLYYHYHRTTEERRTKLVIKGLSPNIPLTDIAAALNYHPYKIHHMWEMKRRLDNDRLQGLGLYIIETNRQDTGQIKTNIRQLLHHRVTIEDYRQTDRVPRCDNCQKLHHTRQYCRRKTTCGKCSDNHPTEQCPNHYFKCANCGQGHPTYSPDCKTMQEARQERQKTLLQTRQQQTRQQNPPATLLSKDFPGLPDIDATRLRQTYGNNSRTDNTNSTSTLQDIKELLTLLKSCNITKLISTLKDIITICKQPIDSTTKIITVLTKVCDLF